MEKEKINMNIPKEKFAFANANRRLTDKKFDTKPIGYFKDAWIRFCKNKASVTAAIIIVGIILYSIIVPLLTFNYDVTFNDIYYSKMSPRNLSLRSIGLADGGSNSDYNERALIKEVSKGIAAEDAEGKGYVTWEQGMASYYQPVLKINGEVTQNGSTWRNARVDDYLSLGFKYISVEQAEYAKIVEWQEATGIRVIYPLVDRYNQYCVDKTDANFWYKTDAKANPISTKSGSDKKISYDALVEGRATLEDNYKRDASGNVVYWEYTGGGNFETAQYNIRILYYNYYRYLNGFEPEYIFGTDSQGYDLALRLASGIKLSLLVSICVSVINFLIGGIYGAIEGYYGGATDLIMERISDILSGIPFVVVATLFQIHLAKKVGPIPSLLFAFVLTGWIGTASLVRTQFYRFKNQEYIMAARTLGAKDSRIIWKHIFPNSLGTIITSSVLVIPGVIFSESMLSYLGIVKLGGSKMTSLGTLLSDAAGVWTNYPHLMIVPAVVISLLMICFNLFGNGLRDAFNPSLRGVEE